MVYGEIGYAGWAIYKVVLFVLASFVFSLIFWGTKNWLDKKHKKRR